MGRRTAWTVGMRAAVVGSVLGAALAGEYAFAYDGVVGTSFDLRVTARGPVEAGTARDAALAEIARLEAILSAYEPSAELARVNATDEWVKVSPELLEVLGLYERWGVHTGGVVSAMGTWEVAGASLRRGAGKINIDALGKAYIVERVAAKLREVDGLGGALVDIGGDIRAWGRDGEGKAWRVGVADPMNPADNAPVLGVIDLDDAAVASSGGYARGRHIVDPRTGLPADQVAGTTVLAGDAVAANALATALVVVGPREGLEMATRLGAESVVVATDGAITASGGMGTMNRPAPPQMRQEADAPGWPAGYQVSAALDIPPGPKKKNEKPFVALWIEDDKGNYVRTVEVWGGIGKEAKYLKDMRAWWKWGSKDAQMVKAVTRATRLPGQYTLVWDGKDQLGNAVKPGTYTIWLEVASDHGPRASGSGKIVCGKDPTTGTIDKTASFNLTNLTYGPKETPK